MPPADDVEVRLRALEVEVARIRAVETNLALFARSVRTVSFCIKMLWLVLILMLTPFVWLGLRTALHMQGWG